MTFLNENSVLKSSKLTSDSYLLILQKKKEKLKELLDESKDKGVIKDFDILVEPFELEQVERRIHATKSIARIVEEKVVYTIKIDGIPNQMVKKTNDNENSKTTPLWLNN